ncbi:ABC transporter permease [Acetanaerobacterium sp. MSJ-12]|uniref:ABC transporter permease n=1 Tax=Bittarella massiliensis (ex Durand et al. 2017) TaxID=1720313 RepID=A0AAW5KB17_9FIRM|nr:MULTISPECIES: ABC transporter permease [Oscillospiraceae]MBC2871764.1 ABC transporter permease [Bittarella massiliensis (ex Durand et al. 2017)]MBU5419922.1 ABC transporter permease [Acetanaerobacterium sp. MSJ-12]MCQ4949197.1 ABC transporter permease [Bittarella massiliensis (ex Durand et al. 2017)]
MGFSAVSLIVSTLRMSIPLLIAGMGAVYASRSGMMAMGVESMMLFGAFGGVFTSYFTGNVLLGFLTGMVCGAAVGLLFGLLTVRFRLNQVIAGVGLNLFMGAITTVLMEVVWKSSGNSPQVASLTQAVRVPLLSDIPVVGTIFSSLSVNFYIALVLLVITQYVVFHTPFGLRLRMVGENPTAANTLGIPVRGYKYTAMLICGGCAGLAGAYLSLDQLNMFVQEMTAGRGFIVLVMMALGKYTPVGTVLAALLFGFADALQINLQQAFDVPSQLVQMMPYIVTILVLTFGIKHVKGPAGTGKLPEE